jgi:hypothetical protein
MRRIILLLASVAITVLSVSGIVLALPSETPDDAPMVDGHVRAFAKVGGNVWVGGSFSRVEQRDGAVTEDVGNAASSTRRPDATWTSPPSWAARGSTVYDLGCLRG